MKLRPVVVLGVIAALARLYPKTAAVVAFECGVLTGMLLKRLRRRRTANVVKVIDVVPTITPARPRKRKPAARKPAARRRVVRKPRKPAATPAVAEAA